MDFVRSDFLQNPYFNFNANGCVQAHERLKYDKTYLLQDIKLGN